MLVMKKIILYILAFLLPYIAIAQNKKDKKASKEETANIMEQLSKTFNSKAHLYEMCRNTCTDFDSIEQAINKGAEVDINKVLEEEVISIARAYSLMASLLSINTEEKGDKQINVNMNGNANDVQLIQEWLLDSCTAYRNLLNTKDDKSLFGSSTDNEIALKAYNNGLDKMQSKDYATAASFFEEAVKADTNFAYAYDNLGVCNRKLEKFDKAIIAYNKSIAIEPNNTMPYQNLAIIYSIQKNYNQAIKTYEALSSINPRNPEVFYGMGELYYQQEKYTEALNNFCKAYLMYQEMKSPYKADAESYLSKIYKVYKDNKNETEFKAILKKNGIDME
jgi:tetratricopeptide (TPR) repeat protein